MTKLHLRVHGKESKVTFVIINDGNILASGWYANWRKILHDFSPELFGRVYVDWRSS